MKMQINPKMQVSKKKTYLNQEKDSLTHNQEKEYLVRRGKDCNCDLG